MQNSQADACAATRIQAFYRGRMSRQRTRRIRKLLTYRKHIIKELIDTEAMYIYDLSLIISDFKYPMRSLKLLSSQELAVIFTNVEELKKLNEEFYCELSNRFDHYFPYQLMFDIVIKLTPFFKIYFEYCNNYEQGQRTIVRLRKERSEFDEYLRVKCNQDKFRRLGIDGFLIKPVQRLPKYVILLKDLVKHTPEDHPDLNNIKGALNAFDKVVYHNNQSMGKVLNNLRIAELQSITKESLVQPGRQFILEENVTVLKQNDVKDLVMYIFNDLMLLTRRTRNGQQVELKMALSRASFINQLDDLSYYKNLFLLYGGDGECCTFVCQSPAEKEKLMEMISRVVAKAGQKQVDKARLFITSRIKNESVLRKIEQSDYPVEVDVIGTEERSSNKVTKHTVYIIQVKIRNVKQKIFMRYAELLEVQKLVNKRFPDLRNINPLTKSNWIGNHQNKIIEERKLAIQMYLQSLLSMRVMKERGSIILYALGLPEDFYTLHEKFRLSQEENDQQPMRSSFFDRCSTKTVAPRHTMMMEKLDSDDSDEEVILKRKKNPFRGRKNSHQRAESFTKKKLSVEELLQVNEMFLGHFTRNSELAADESHQSQQIITIPVYVYSDSLEDQVLSVPMRKRQRIQNLIIQVAKTLEMMYYKDYRCFLEHDQSVRILDDDELIESIYSEVSRVLFKAKVRFKKFIYIHDELEDRELKNDEVRLKMMASQLLCEVKNMCFKLSYQNYLVLLSLFLMLNGCDAYNRIVLLVAKRLLPNDIYNEFEDDEWLKDIQKSYEIVSSRIKQVKAANIAKQQSYKEHLSSLKFEEVKSNLTRLDSLIRTAIIGQLKTEPLYGVVLTIVQISQATRQYFQKQTSMDFSSRNIWLGLKYDRVMLMIGQNHHLIRSFRYEQIVDLECYPNSIKLIIDDGSCFKLKTTLSFFLSETILYYKKYSEVYEKISQDNEYEHLIEKARQHMRSVVMEMDEIPDE